MVICAILCVMKNLNKTIERLIEVISIKNQTVSFAESCTGGRIATAFTAVSGSSAILHGSCVTYANEIKEQWLGVPRQVLIDHGAVSKECVNHMLIGMQKMANSDYTLAVSGIAGPTGGTPTKPVGTVYIGLLTPEKKSIIHHCHFKGDRHQVQEQATHFAIELLEKNVN